MTDLDRVRRELLAVADRLEAAPADAFAERAELRGRQQELRAEAARLRRGSPATREAMEAELAQLRRRLDGVADARMGMGSAGAGGGSGGGGIDPAVLQRFNRVIDRGQGRDEMEARIRELRRHLAELDDDS